MFEIIELAKKLFDVVGSVGKFLILGLESRPGQDLDEFEIRNGSYVFPGFEKFFAPKISQIIEALKAAGFTASQQRDSNTRIKLLAVRAGIGEWGKNSLVIHSKFGPRLRFAVIEASSNFPTISRDHLAICGHCSNCDECLHACPVADLLHPFFLTDKEACLAYLNLDKPGVKSRCDKCQVVCPVGK